MRAGWSIDGLDECLKNGNIEVPLNYQNQSLVVQGSVRVILESGQVEVLAVKLSSELMKTAEEGLGWKKMDGFWLGVRHSHRYQSPLFIPELRHQSEVMCRSTLGGGTQWELVEVAEPLMKLLDQEEEIEELQGREGKVLRKEMRQRISGLSWRKNTGFQGRGQTCLMIWPFLRPTQMRINLVGQRSRQFEEMMVE